MAIVSAIGGFFTALPDIIKMIQAGAVWINHVSGNDPAGLVKRVGAAMNQLNLAQTQQERIDAAAAIAASISNL